MRLNLGAGDMKMSGYVNIDLSPNADLVHDLRTPLPYEDNSVEEIFAMHLIESFYQWQFPAILKDWYRVMASGAKLTIEFTSLTNTINMYLNGSTEEKRSGHWGLYGRQDIEVDPIVLHHYVYEKEELEELLLNTGFKEITFTEDDVNHKRGRDYRVHCQK